MASVTTSEFEAAERRLAPHLGRAGVALRDRSFQPGKAGTHVAPRRVDRRDLIEGREDLVGAEAGAGGERHSRQF